MIICICRNIKDSDFSRQEDLIERIMQMDKNCGQCQEYVQKLKELLYEVEWKVFWTRVRLPPGPPKVVLNTVRFDPSEDARG